MNVEEIYSLLKRVVETSSSSAHVSADECVGLLTSDHRDTWADLHEALMKGWSCMCLSVRPLICACVCLSVRSSVHLSVCPSVHLCMCLSLRPFICACVCLSVRSSVHMSVCPSVHLCVCLSVRSFVHVSVCPSVHLCIRRCFCIHTFFSESF